MSAPVNSRAIQTTPTGPGAVKASIQTDLVSPHRQSKWEASPATDPHHLYRAIDVVAETEWSDPDEFEAQVVQTEHQIEVHLNEIILESVALLKRARARHKFFEEASADQADAVTACEALRDRALEKRQELLEELELAVNAGRRTFCQAPVSGHPS